jgi:hypothetical protein
VAEGITSDVVGDLRNTLGKSLLAAGLAPAVAALGIVYWYEHRNTLSLASAISAEAKNNPVGNVLLVLIVALPLYVFARASLAWVRSQPAKEKQITAHDVTRSVLENATTRLPERKRLLRWAKDGLTGWKPPLWRSDFDAPLDSWSSELKRLPRCPLDPTYEGFFAKLETRAKAHDDGEPGAPLVMPAAFEVLDAYLENQRDAVSRAWNEHPSSARRFRLGELSGALDDYPRKRYGMSTPTMLPRLMNVVADDVRERLSAASATVECLFGFLLAGYAVLLWIAVDQVSLAGPRQFDGQALAAMILCAIAVVTCWYAAPAAFRSFASQTIATIDTQRQLVLEKLGLGKDLDLESEKTAFLAAGSFFAHDADGLARLHRRPRVVKVTITKDDREAVADGRTLIPIHIAVSCEGAPFTNRQVTVWASRGDFAVAEPGKPLNFTVTGTRDREQRVWRAAIHAHYISSSRPGKVDLVASCGAESHRLSIDLQPVTPQLTLDIEKLESLTEPSGLQVSLRTRIRSEGSPDASFVGEMPTFTVAPEAGAAQRWAATPFADDNSATATWFVPTSRAAALTFSVAHGTVKAEVVLPASAPAAPP